MLSYVIDTSIMFNTCNLVRTVRIGDFIDEYICEYKAQIKLMSNYFIGNQYCSI